MAGLRIYTANLEEFTALNFRDKPVVKYYKRVYNFVKHRLGEGYANIWATPLNLEKPLLPTGRLSWASEILNSKPKPITEIPDTERANISRSLEEKTKAIQGLADELSESSNPDDLEWAELLNLMLQTPSREFVYTDGSHAVLVMWGFQLTQGYPKRERPVKKKPKNATNTTRSKVEGPNKKETSGQSGVREVASFAFSEESHDDKGNVEESQGEDERLEDAPATQEPTASTQDENKKRRRWPWIVLILLIVLAIIAFIVYVFAKPKNPLPSEPGVYVPIDSNTIRLDGDSMSFIASDRLNISLVGKNKNLKKFAKQFKKLYPGKEFEIIYFDTVTYRLQVQLPAERREELQQQLEAQMPDYELLMWEENLYEIEYTPTDPAFSDQSKYWYHENIKTFEAWNVTMGDPNLIVAIIDNGFDLRHPEFSGKVYKPWNIVGRSSNISTYGHMDHGTHVAGIATGLANNSQGLCGVAPACKLMPIQVGDPYGRISTTAIIDGVLYAINNGASVINISLGKKFHPSVGYVNPNAQLDYIRNSDRGEEQFWERLYGEAEKHGVTIVFAGGNQNALIGLDPMVRSNKVVKVSATTPGYAKASFSNYGPYSSLSAPGTQILSSVPGGGYDYMDGTSMASPVVAGAIALLKSVNPAYTTYEIVELLQSTGLPTRSGARQGRIIQLDRVLGISSKKRGQLPKATCEDVQHKMDSLLRELERLKRQCTTESSGDTLKMPVDSNSLSLLYGRWRSTTPIYSVANGEPVDLVFDLNPNSSSSIQLLEEYGETCDGPISLTYTNSELTMDQRQNAICRATGSEYSSYTFLCVQGVNNCAKCKAINNTNATNEFWFELIRINP